MIKGEKQKRTGVGGGTFDVDSTTEETNKGKLVKPSKLEMKGHYNGGKLEVGDKGAFVGTTVTEKGKVEAESKKKKNKKKKKKQRDKKKKKKKRSGVGANPLYKRAVLRGGRVLFRGSR